MAPVPLPLTARAQIEQAAAAGLGALAAGNGARQRIELLLPVAQRARDFTLTDAVDYPPSAEEVFRVALSCAQALLSQISGVPVASLRSQRFGDADSPAGVVATDDGAYAVVVTPAAEHLKEIRSLTERPGRRCVLLLNTQWNESGQVISDFGFGPWKRAADDFLNTFTPVFTLQERRVGAASTVAPDGRALGLGGVARLLRAAPHGWSIFAMGGDGSAACVRVQPTEPTYAELAAIFTRTDLSLRQRRAGDMSQEAALEASAGAATGGAGTDWALVSAAEVAAAVRAGALKPDDCDALDKSALRSALLALQLPTAGKQADLRERLRQGLQAAAQQPEAEE